ncbi:hypothetical protein J2T17_006393 [Paenibacillus mucilaginosus]|uniref:hypothetical protein n=1 Tax=Paenibacillus mucilaginosus TaxID=61624 RepID=UPI003D2301B8
MQFSFNLEDLVKFTANALGRGLEANEFIVSASVSDGRLNVETRVFSDDEPVIGDKIIYQGKYYRIAGYNKQGYNAAHLDKYGLIQDNRHKYSTLIYYDNAKDIKVVNRD